jgi:hypothetical protein
VPVLGCTCLVALPYTCPGDLPVFAQLLGDGDARKPFNGPAALIGLDVLAQRRVVLEAIPPALARTVGRRRRLFVAKKG